MTAEEIGSIIGVYIATLIIYIGCYLIIARLESVFAEGEKLNDDVKQRRKIRIGMRWLFWRADKKDNAFLVIFVHQIITILFTAISSIIFTLSIVRQNADLNLSLAIFAFAYLIYIVTFDNITKYKIKRNSNS